MEGKKNCEQLQTQIIGHKARWLVYHTVMWDAINSLAPLPALNIYGNAESKGKQKPEMCSSQAPYYTILVFGIVSFLTQSGLFACLLV